MSRQPIKIHYSGGLRIFGKNGGVTTLYAGYPCCAYGERAEKIKRDGNHTENDAKVSCAACLKLIDRARENGSVGTRDYSRLNLALLREEIEGGQPNE
jgi:hypothetical protein